MHVVAGQAWASGCAGVIHCSGKSRTRDTGMMLVLGHGAGEDQEVAASVQDEGPPVEAPEGPLVEVPGSEVVETPGSEVVENSGGSHVTGICSGGGQSCSSCVTRRRSASFKRCAIASNCSSGVPIPCIEGGLPGAIQIWTTKVRQTPTTTPSANCIQLQPVPDLSSAGGISINPSSISSSLPLVRPPSSASDSSSSSSSSES
mmetsp:Transcript_32328/g.77544  ORF Transcript_32328/g.77544 Transcript_32328/m.77544 type:complete len:203 (-) Transcript_32328:65-673(-)